MLRCLLQRQGNGKLRCVVLVCTVLGSLRGHVDMLPDETVIILTFSVARLCVLCMRWLTIVRMQG